MKKNFLTLSWFLFLSLLSPNPIFADCRQTGCPTTPNTYCEPGSWVCQKPVTSTTTSGGCTGTTGFVCTALGDIPTDPADLVKWILGWSIAMGSGIAFLLALWGGVTIILAAGNPEKINEGKEIITSAVSGLLFILFSVFLLRLIGVNVLEIFTL